MKIQLKILTKQAKFNEKSVKFERNFSRKFSLNGRSLTLENAMKSVLDSHKMPEIS
jgi:hypothetical protein